MTSFISTAYAAGSEGAQAQGDGMFSLIMIVAIFVVFYFFLIRPQNKRAKEHRELISNLKKGDEVVTSGGIVGKIVKVNDQFLTVTLADGVDVNMQRSAVSVVLPKGTIKSI